MVDDAPVPTLSRSFHVHVELGPIEDHGQTQAGHRRVVPIVGGTVSGELTGTILSGGADHQVVLPDGTVVLDARYSARLDDDSLILIHARGVRSGSPETLQALLAGAAIPPSEYYFRTHIAIESSTHRELEHALFVGSCLRGRDHVSYDAYRVD